MSELLEDLIKRRKEEVVDYEKYLKEMEELLKKVKQSSNEQDYPEKIDTRAKKALYDNLGANTDLAYGIHEKVTYYKPDGWRGNTIKEKKVKNLIKKTLEEYGEDEGKVHYILDIVKNQKEY